MEFEDNTNANMATVPSAAVSRAVVRDFLDGDSTHDIAIRWGLAAGTIENIIRGAMVK